MPTPDAVDASGSSRILWTVSQMTTARKTENNFQPKSFVSQSRMGLKDYLEPGFNVGRGSFFVMTAGPGLCRSPNDERNHLTAFCDFAGCTITEVRNERNSSSVTPRTSWPL